MDYNNELEKIDTEIKAYFLGFMYADGCITATKRKNSNYIKPQVQISLADEQIILEFKNNFPFFNLQSFDFSKYKSTWNKQFALRKADKNLFHHLKSHGVLERKSGENSKNLKFPNLQNNLINHFIRGYFDGDGSVSIPKKRDKSIRIEICGSSKSFLQEIKTILEENKIRCPIFREKHNNKSPLYVLEWVYSKDIIDFANFLYKNSTIRLNRKKEKFDIFLEYTKNRLNKAQLKQGELLETPITKIGQSAA